MATSKKRGHVQEAWRRSILPGLMCSWRGGCAQGQRRDWSKSLQSHHPTHRLGIFGWIFSFFDHWKHLETSGNQDLRVAFGAGVAKNNRDAVTWGDVDIVDLVDLVDWASPSDPERPRRSGAPVPDSHFAATCISTGTSEQPRSLGALTRWPRREARTQQQ